MVTLEQRVECLEACMKQVLTHAKETTSTVDNEVAATPEELLRTRLMSPHTRKSELEWFAKREIDEVLELISSYGSTDGEHHKQWLLDQVIRILTGDRYGKWVKNFEAGEEGIKTYEWDIGIAP